MNAATDPFQIVRAAVARGPIPGATMACGDRRSVRLGATGLTRTHPPGRPVLEDTIYDLASMTKVIVTATLLARLHERGRLDVRAPLAEALPEVRGCPLETATVLELATHTAGLEAISRLQHWGLTRDAALRRALREPRPRPTGEILYSDQGYLVLGYLLERVYGKRLDAVADAELFGPLGLELTFHPDPARCAETEISAADGPVPPGRVHDENCAALGGVSGHAGLFGTARAVSGFIVALVDGRILGPEGLKLLTTEHARVGADRRAFGWMLKHHDWSGGDQAPERALGHTGFTGTGAWWDPITGRHHVLLTNRVHPTRHAESHIHELRRAFNDAAWAPEVAR
jgi:CubicO group peptidase (beta-lactamase class C family)